MLWSGVLYYSGCYQSGAKYYSGCYGFDGTQYYSGCYGFGVRNIPAASTTYINYVSLRRIAVKYRFRVWLYFILPLIKEHLLNQVQKVSTIQNALQEWL